MNVKKSPSDTRDHQIDETYRLLRRRPINELDAHFRKNYWYYYSNPKAFDQWLAENGYASQHEFTQAGTEYEKRLRESGNIGFKVYPR